MSLVLYPFLPCHKYDLVFLTFSYSYLEFKLGYSFAVEDQASQWPETSPSMAD